MKNLKNLMTSFKKTGNCCRKLNINPKVNAQSTIMKRRLKGHPKVEKIKLSSKNPGAHFSLQISTNQRLGNYADYDISLPKKMKLRTVFSHISQ